jgi:hypothetical protein
LPSEDCLADCHWQSSPRPLASGVRINKQTKEKAPRKSGGIFFGGR